MSDLRGHLGRWRRAVNRVASPAFGRDLNSATLKEGRLSDGESADPWCLPPPRIHDAIARLFSAGRLEYAQFIGELEGRRTILHSIPSCAADRKTPHWRNGFFSCLDAAALIGMLLRYRPRRYVEIGSGNSTLFARYAVRAAELETKMMSIDPEPRLPVDDLCDRVIRRPVQEVSPAFFSELQSGDVLFIDGSHRAEMDSDVNWLVFEILPTLKPGVIVHVHDIFWPRDYPEQWRARGYTEQYVVGALLLGSRYQVVLPNNYVCCDAELSVRVRSVFAGGTGQRDIPFYYAGTDWLTACSLWLKVLGASQVA